MSADRPRHHSEFDLHTDRDGAGTVGDGGAVERVATRAVAFDLDLADAPVLVERDDPSAHGGQWTIFAIGSSMIPLAPASLSAGMSTLMSLLGTTVSTA